MLRLRPAFSRLASPSRTRRSRLRPAMDRLEERALMAVTITEFSTVAAGAVASGIRHFADGSTLFIDRPANSIGFLSADTLSVASESKIPTPNSLPAEVTESGGFYWFTELLGPKIGRLTLDGKTFTEFPVPTAFSNPDGITAGPDGAVWFTENSANKIGRITTDGTITEFTVPTAVSFPAEIVTGPLGDLYFTEFDGNKIGQITPAGVITEFTVPTAASLPNGIDVGTNGNDIVFTEQNANKIGRLVITAGVGGAPSTGAFKEFAIPTPDSNPVAVVSGLDGNVYFTELNGNNIGRITSDGTVTEYPIPTANARPTNMTYVAGPNAELLFNEQGAQQIGRVLLPGVLNISAPTTVIEGQNRFATFTVTRSQGSNGPVSVTYATVQGTAFSPEDFTATTGTISFADGDLTPKTFTVPITDNGTLELLPNQTFSATLATPTGQATIGTGTATVGIIDNTPREVSVNDVTVNELAGTVAFTVSLNTASALPITVMAQTADGTAQAGSDYTAEGPVVLTFPAGVTSQAFTVRILDTLVNGVSSVAEPTETFTVTLSNATNAVIAKAQGTGTIIDNDTPLVVTATPISLPENATASLPVASFIDPDGDGTNNPLVTNGQIITTTYAASIVWNDGTGKSDYINLTTNTFGNIDSPVHVFPQAGVYSVRVTVARTRTLKANAGPPGVDQIVSFTSTTVIDQAVISDAPLTGTALNPPVGPIAGRPFIDQTITTFTDAGGQDDPGSYIATIDYGDGTPISPGVVFNANAVPMTPPDGVTPAMPGFLAVAGSHTFANPGTYNVAVTLRSEGGRVATSTRATVVPAAPTTTGFLSGFLNPASDSGVSNSDAITNVKQPNFEGFANPGATVRYFAQAPGGTPFQIGQGAADASGFYSITSFSPLADGQYTITAAFSNLPGVGPTAIQVLPTSTKGPLVIDTVAPKVTSLTFDRLTGTLQVGLQDDRSGLDVSTLRDGANYRLSSPHAPSLTTRVTGLAVANGAASAVQTVTLTFNHGQKLKFGVYTFLARSGGIRDVAGNALDGEFYGSFPSGNGRPGGDFVADFAAFHNITRPPGSPNGSVSPTVTTVTPAVKLAKAKATSHHAPTAKIASRQVMFPKHAK